MTWWEQLLTRETVITLAVAGAVTATAGSWLHSRQIGGRLGRVMYWAGYACTGFSILLFIVVGFSGLPSSR